MKKTKIIIPALGMLLLSTAASVSGTVAWFSMNASVTVTGMTVTTKVSSNLQIAEHNFEEQYGDALQQARSGILEPASSIDAVDYFYTVKASGDGAAKEQGTNGADTYTSYNENASPAIANAYAGKANYDKGFNNAYGFSSPAVRANANEKDEMSYGYIDYTFYLKAGYANDADRISLTKCNMLYKNSAYGAIETAWAWRVGMLVQDAATPNADVDTALASSNLKTILDFANSKNQNEVNKPVVAKVGDDVSGLYTTSACTGDAIPASSTVTADGTYQPATYYRKGDAAPKAVDGTDDGDLVAVTNANANAIVEDAANLKNKTKRYKVTVRLWLEGEDTSCTTSTFADLTNDWKLDLEFKLGDPAASGYIPVTAISTVAA